METPDTQIKSSEIIKSIGIDAKTFLSKAFEKISEASLTEAHLPKGETKRIQTLYSLGFAQVNLLAIAHELKINLEKCVNAFLEEPPEDFFKNALGVNLAQLPKKTQTLINSTRLVFSEGSKGDVFEIDDDILEKEINIFEEDNKTKPANAGEIIVKKQSNQPALIPSEIQKKALDIVAAVKKSKKSKKNAIERLNRNFSEYDFSAFVDENWANQIVCEKQIHDAPTVTHSKEPTKDEKNAALSIMLSVKKSKKSRSVAIEKIKQNIPNIDAFSFVDENWVGVSFEKKTASVSKEFEEEVVGFIAKMRKQKKGIKFIKELAIKKYGKDSANFF